ncbi:MAG: response regulator [bacterium]
MGKIIMIVDDDELGRELLIIHLKRYFNLLSSSEKIMPEIVQAGDGEQAWNLLTQGIRPNFMIIDYQMPKMDGIKLIDKIQAEMQLNSEIVMLSGFFPAENEAKQRGCHFALKKMEEIEKIFKLATEKGLFVVQSE